MHTTFAHAIVFRMAETGQTRLPVVERENGNVAGMISLHDLPGARVRNLNEERHRERVLQPRLPFPKESAPEDDTAQPERNQ
jgi:CIC family chloride channel protein